MPAYKDVTGMRFGRLVAQRLVERRNGIARWLCDCDCGNTTVVHLCNLTNGTIKSCGCLRRETTRRNGLANTRHGGSHDPLYYAWQKMKYACECQTSIRYKYVGGRGIRVCDEWHIYENFREWATCNGYSPELVFTRLDINKNYEPSNCAFKPRRYTLENKVCTLWLTYGGERKRVQDWAQILGVNYNTVVNRKRNGRPMFTAKELSRYVGGVE